MKALPLLLSVATLSCSVKADTLVNPFTPLWETKHEAALEQSALKLSPSIQKHLVMIGRLGLLEVRPGVILTEQGDILAPYLAPIDAEDDAPYLLYLPDGSRQTLELIAEKPKRSITHLRAKSLPDSLAPATRAEENSLIDSHWFLIPVIAPLPHLGEPFAINRDHAFPRPEKDAVTFSVARGPYPGGTPIFDLAGRLLAIQTVPDEPSGWNNQPLGRAFTIPRIVEDFPELAKLLNDPTKGFLTALPKNPFPEEDEDGDKKDIEESPLEKARASHATQFLPSENPPYAVILNEGKAITHSITGVFLRPDGLLLTKASELGPNLTARFKSQTYPAALLATDEDTDLALVALIHDGTKTFPIIEWSAPHDLNPGATLLAPILLQEADESMSGDSTTTLGAFSHHLKDTPSIHETNGGASLGLITEQAANILTVAALQQDTSAQKSGLKVGDKLLALNDQKLSDRASLVKLLTPLPVGQEVTLLIERGGKEQEFKIILARPHLSPPPTGINLQGTLTFIPSIRRSEFPELIIHTLPLDSWDCGSPLYTIEGKAIGLNIAAHSKNRSIALPPATIKAAVTRMLSQSRTF